MRTKILTIVLPASALAFLITIAFGFKPLKSSKTTETATLTFRYDGEAYDETNVTMHSNWTLVNNEQACAQTADDIPCSFSIEVDENNQALYLNGTEPSSQVIIEADESALTANNYYVSDIKENITGTPSFTGDISNVQE